jgi:hypothetical protein
MSEELYSSQLVVDNRVKSSESLKLPVLVGGALVNHQSYKSNSASNNATSWNIQVPSNETMIDKKIWMSYKFTTELTLSQAAVPDAAAAVLVAKDLLNKGAFATTDFPLNKSITNCNILINNMSINQVSRDVIKSMQSFLNVDGLNNTGACTPIINISGDYTDTTSFVNNVLGNDSTTVITRGLNPRGDGSFVVATFASNSTTVVNITFKIYELLCVSPLQFGNNCYERALYGINNLQFNFNTDFSNLIKFNNTPSGGTTIVSFSAPVVSDAQLYLKYLSPKPEMLPSARNCHPLYEFSRFETSEANIDAPVAGVPSEANYTSNNMQLNQIPRYLVIDPHVPSTSASNEDGTLEITKISITFNNDSGILASADEYQLKAMSLKNSGDFNTFEMQRNRPLILEFGTDIQLPQSFSAPNSLGAYNLFYTLTVRNNLDRQATNVKLRTVLVNQGVFVLESGSASKVMGLWDKNMVLNALSSQPFSLYHIKEFVGHGKHTLDGDMEGTGLFDILKTVVGATVKPLANLALDVVPLPGFVKSVGRNIIGSGVSGGGYSGGVQSIMDSYRR